MPQSSALTPQLFSSHRPARLTRDSKNATAYEPADSDAQIGLDLLLTPVQYNAPNFAALNWLRIIYCACVMPPEPYLSWRQSFVRFVSRRLSPRGLQDEEVLPRRSVKVMEGSEAEVPGKGRIGVVRSA
ncbi:hypothetical protein EVAR_28662_1 [Eumeta japonica]|uniref:Uncharacterized protein n=1 Tax=Eumeta variegata TaxID=151549 RepID=A0A4C1V5G5_EUMVA|nr:hypothetical protein EVAR_28662_1 [Eumeta japonica]